jgi:hypothetical protein
VKPHNAIRKITKIVLATSNGEASPQIKKAEDAGPREHGLGSSEMEGRALITRVKY